VTDISLAFFRQFAPSIAAGTYDLSTPQYSQLTSAIETFADGFVEVAAKYTPPDGGLSEQFQNKTGAPLSAADLTWSYASVLTAGDSRAGVVPVSWGAKGLIVPPTCTPNPGPQVSVAFEVLAYTQFGENIYLTGSVDALKDWSPDDALLLSAANYPIWNITVVLPANANINYKYIRKFQDKVTWESDPDNSFKSPPNGSITRCDVWR